MIQAQPHPLVRWVHTLWQVHPPLMLSVFITLVMAVFFAVGILLDPRYITGAPAWLKPLKFAISISIYSFTMVWMLGFIRGRKRLVNVLGWMVVLMFALEWVAILIQVARGVGSHFNVSTPFDTSLFSLMGLAIVMLSLTTLAVAILLLLQRFENRTLGLSVRLAVLITLVGMNQAFLMTSPTARQMAGLEAGESVTLLGAHSVGVDDGGRGLPFVNWSTEGGDLRVGHFVGMHALQVLPFVGFLLGRVRRLSEQQKVRLVWTAGLGYLGLTLLLTWQALRAQPIIAPDVLTLGVLLALMGAMGLSSLWITAVKEPIKA